MDAQARTGYLNSSDLHFKVLFAVTPLVTGGAIPMFGLVNLLWGSVYGAPAFLFHWLRIPHPLAFDLVWILVWPIAATWLLGRLGAKVATLARPARLACLMVFAMSLLAVWPGNWILMDSAGAGFGLDELPLYMWLLDY